ncbi:MAG: hypothetical protein CMP63_02530 [Flavobacteriales bacterium]|nr:hypothetical protein [Flavobacteriales bacterium]
MINKVINILLFIPLFVNAQLTNDWINYNQNYFKFPIAEDGIYRINFQQLVNAGLNISTLDPRNFQIFAKGEEIPIYIQGESDGSFDYNDFIEFYAEKNTGWYDHVLFSDSAHVLNPYISMFTDTLYHFLTWNSSTNNFRMKDEVDLNFNSFTPSKYFWSEFISMTNLGFSYGYKTHLGKPVPEYSEGEGWYSSILYANHQARPVVSTPHAYKSGPDGWVKLEMVGLTLDDRLINVFVNDNKIYDDNLSNNANVYLEEKIPAESWEDISTFTIKNIADEYDSGDVTGIAYVHLRYPKKYNMGGASSALLYIPAGDESKDLLVIENYDNLNSSARLYDVTNGHRIQVQPLSGKYYALVPNEGNERKCYLTTDLSVKSVSNIVSVSDGSSKFINYKDLITQKGGIDYLLLTGHDLLDVANEYAEYREEKGLKSLVFDMDQLYDQFSYGIRKHPMSIRSLVDAIINNWEFNPQYLFLCGKSITADYYEVRYGNQFEENIVPTWGVLGSDGGFTSGLTSGTVLEPSISTGRLAVPNEEQLNWYLNKVKAYELSVSDEWMKQVLHFGGGIDQSEQSIYKQYLEKFESIIEDSLFGGNVHTFLKNSSDPLQINLSDSVSSLINNGVSLMTFFGHAYGQNFDQSIDDPDNYENMGKYSFILANSCLIGNIHTNNYTSGSEKFVLSEDKGSIGFLGSSSLGVPSYLYQYSRNFYENLGKDYYGYPVGKVVQQTIKDMQDSSNILNRDVAMHMTLHCDPAVVINSHVKSDYTVYSNNSLTKPNVFFEPGQVSSELDSFNVYVVVKNIGKALGDTFDLLITRDFPNQGFPDTTYSFEVSGLFYSDTFKLKLPVDKINGVGLNKFYIRADGLSEIDELNEMNNNVEVNLFINSSDIVPVFPYEYAIVPESESVLKASTANPYAPLTKYYFQIDTCDAFDSPVMVEEIIESNGGVIEWNPSESNLLSGFYSKFSNSRDLDNPQVFFWRVSSDSSLNNGFLWKESTFQSVSDKSGWGQAHFHQFKDNEYNFIDYKYVNRTTDFIKQSKILKAKTHLSAGLYMEEIKYEIDGAIQCFTSSHWDKMFFVAVIDNKTLQPWHAQDHGDYGHLNFVDDKVISGWSEYNFYFKNDILSETDKLINFVNEIPDSNYVLFYSFNGNYCQSGFTNSLSYENMFKEIGANVDSLKNYPNNYPYILFFKKGDSGSVIESFSPDGEDFITLTAEMENYWYNGTIESSVIGPSSKWGSFHWDISSREPGNTQDTGNVSIYGIDYNGGEHLLIEGLSGTGDLYGLEDSIDASLYPYLKLKSFFADDLNRTPDDLIRWQVTYDEIPEAAINSLKMVGYELMDSVQQGENLQLIIAVENITNIHMDSLQVSYKVIDHEYANYPFTYTLKAPLNPHEVIFDTIVVPTSTLISDNKLWYEINPFVGPVPWQLEQYHFNNLYSHDFTVYGDEINPILDITFDGVHILDGDIVSPNANIVITLDDENQYLILDDESLVQVFINYPNSTYRDSLVLIDPSEYVFRSADLPKNKCTIEYQGDFKTDGIYDLRIMAKDKSSNISGSGDGTYDQRVSFEIMTESSITQLINYPNPFSTSTRFVFTLTGSELPDNILIQIMTITGKVVKEITQDELGPIRIGRNITEYEWDGTDKYGDKLANGVYLYRVKVEKDGSALKEREVTISSSEGTNSLSNQFFKKGIGKMYILR